jgi:hypothetical protein
VADLFEDCASGGQLGFELGFADPSEPEAISEEVLGLVVGGDYDLETVVFHGALRLVDAQRMSALRTFVEIFFSALHTFFSAVGFPHDLR